MWNVQATSRSSAAQKKNHLKNKTDKQTSQGYEWTFFVSAAHQ